VLADAWQPLYLTYASGSSAVTETGFPTFTFDRVPRAKEGAQDRKETHTMKVTITTGNEMPEQAKAELLNMLWEQTQDKTGGGFRVEHDGGDALSQLDRRLSGVFFKVSSL
jgi:hypothetical protein